jgi:ABC-type multidrug transport system permease subunit
MDRRFLPRLLRMPGWLLVLNLVSGVAFIALGLKGYWDHQSRWFAIGSLFGLLCCGWLVAGLARFWWSPEPSIVESGEDG